MIRFRKRDGKEIAARIARWEPLVLERTPHGWRVTKLTRAGRTTVTAMTVRAALSAAAQTHANFVS